MLVQKPKKTQPTLKPWCPSRWRTWGSCLQLKQWFGRISAVEWVCGLKLTHTLSWNWDNVCLASDMTNSSVIQSLRIFPLQPLSISQNLSENLMTWFRFRLCCGWEGMSGLLLLWLPIALHIFSFGFSPFPYFHIHSSTSTSFIMFLPWVFLAFSNSFVCHFSLLVPGLRSVSLFPINLNSIPIEVHGIFFNLFNQDIKKIRIHREHC